MGELLPNVEPQSPDHSLEIEELADWLLRYELSKGESKQHLPPPEGPPPLEMTPETYFERRHEVKDRPVLLTRTKLEPMTPIAKVLESQYTPPTAQPSQTTPSTQPTMVQTSKLATKPTYQRAMHLGFYAGIVIAFTLILKSV